MEKSLLQGLFCRYIPYQACLIPLLCLGMFQVISWDKEALEKWQHVVWGKKNKSIPSTLGAQQFRIWKSPREFSVFFFFFPIFIHKDGILQQGRFSLLGILFIFILGNYFPH